MFGGTLKKSFFLPPLDHITVEQCQADQTPVTSWCRM